MLKMTAANVKLALDNNKAGMGNNKRSWTLVLDKTYFLNKDYNCFALLYCDRGVSIALPVPNMQDHQYGS